MYMYGFYLDTYIIYNTRWNATPRARCLALLCAYMYLCIAYYRPKRSQTCACANGRTKFQCSKHEMHMHPARVCWRSLLRLVHAHAYCIGYLTKARLENFDVSHPNYLTQMYFLARCLARCLQMGAERMKTAERRKSMTLAQKIEFM